MKGRNREEEPQEKDIPVGIYIDLHGNHNHHYALASTSGPNKTCYVGVYESPDAGHGDPPVKHVIKQGNISIEVTPEMTVEKFLGKLRAGITNLRDKDKE